MLNRALLLAALALGPVAGLAAAEQPTPPGTELLKPVDAAADKTARKFAQIEQRLAANTKRLAAQLTKQEKVAAALTAVEDNLVKLAQQLALIDELTEKGTKEASDSGTNTPTEATSTALEEAREAVAPMQRKKRDWVRQANEGKRQQAEVERAIASLEAERTRLESELTKATAAASVP